MMAPSRILHNAFDENYSFHKKYVVFLITWGKVSIIDCKLKSTNSDIPSEGVLVFETTGLPGTFTNLKIHKRLVSGFVVKYLKQGSLPSRFSKWINTEFEQNCPILSK